MQFLKSFHLFFLSSDFFFHLLFVFIITHFNLFCFVTHFTSVTHFFFLSSLLRYLIFFLIVSPSSLLLFSSLACKFKTSFFYSFDLAVFKNGFLQICILLFQLLLFIFYHAVYSSIPCFIFKNNSIVNLKQIVLQFVNSSLYFFNIQV